MEIDKNNVLELLLSKKVVDLEGLFHISRLPGGFGCNRMRIRVWPKLLRVNRFAIPDYLELIDSHRDDEQVRCDVERSLWNIDHGSEWTEPERTNRREALAAIIKAILNKHANLHYYQGFHDIISVFLLVLEEDQLAFALSEATCLQYFIDCMSPNFDNLSELMKLIMLIVEHVDSELFEYLEKSHVEPFFATSWIITWFSHDIKSLEKIARLFDAMLCSHPSYCLYMCAAVLIYYRSEIMEGECDFPTVHNFLVHIPSALGLPVEELIALSDLLMENLPLEDLITLSDELMKELVLSSKIHWFNGDKVSRFTPADRILLKNINASKPKQTDITEQTVESSSISELNSLTRKAALLWRNEINQKIWEKTGLDIPIKEENRFAACLYQLREDKDNKNVNHNSTLGFLKSVKAPKGNLPLQVWCCVAVIALIAFNPKAFTWNSHTEMLDIARTFMRFWEL